MYRVFRFDKEFPGIVMAKTLTSREEWDKIPLFIKGIYPEDVNNKTAEMLDSNSIHMDITPLVECPSKKDATRKSYLVKQVLECYYPNDSATMQAYFANENDWESEE